MSELIEIIDDNIFLYKGIDFELGLHHPKDGSNGFLIFFTTNYERDFMSFSRNQKLEYLINDNPIVDYSKYDIAGINNSYILIYQTGNNFQELYDIVKSKILNNNLTSTMFISKTQYIGI